MKLFQQSISALVIAVGLSVTGTAYSASKPVVGIADFKKSVAVNWWGGQVGKDLFGRRLGIHQIVPVGSAFRVTCHDDSFAFGQHPPDNVEGSRPHDHDTGAFGDFDVQLLIGFAGPIGIMIRGPGDLSVYGNGDHQADMHGGFIYVLGWLAGLKNNERLIPQKQPT